MRLSYSGDLCWLRGNLWGTAEVLVILFFNIDVVVINFDKLGKVASKWNPNPDLDLDTWKTDSRIFISCVRWKGEAWYPCRHYDKLIVSFSLRWNKMITSLPRLPQQVDKTVKKRITGLTQCYCLGILTEVDYIALFINYDRVLRPQRDNFWCHAVSLARNSSIVCFIET